MKINEKRANTKAQEGCPGERERRGRFIKSKIILFHALILPLIRRTPVVIPAPLPPLSELYAIVPGPHPLCYDVSQCEAAHFSCEKYG